MYVIYLLNDFSRQATIGADNGGGNPGGGEHTDILRPDLCNAIQQFCCYFTLCTPLCRATCSSL